MGDRIEGRPLGFDDCLKENPEDVLGEIKVFESGGDRERVLKVCLNNSGAPRVEIKDAKSNAPVTVSSVEVFLKALECIKQSDCPPRLRDPGLYKDASQATVSFSKGPWYLYLSSIFDDEVEARYRWHRFCKARALTFLWENHRQLTDFEMSGPQIQILANFSAEQGMEEPEIFFSPLVKKNIDNINQNKFSFLSGLRGKIKLIFEKLVGLEQEWPHWSFRDRLSYRWVWHEDGPLVAMSLIHLVFYGCLALLVVSDPILWTVCFLSPIMAIPSIYKFLYTCGESILFMRRQGAVDRKVKRAQDFANSHPGVQFWATLPPEKISENQFGVELANRKSSEDDPTVGIAGLGRSSTPSSDAIRSSF